MELIFKPTAKCDLDFWFKNNKQVLKKIETLLQSMMETPFGGIGKPEALKGPLSGYWSRRITDEHRIIYSVSDGRITIFSLKGHYYKTKLK